jgi:hypothetical protein
MTEILVPEEKTRELNSVSQRAISAAESLMIIGQADMEQASYLLKGFKSAKEAVVNFFKPLKDKAYQTHKEICDREKEMLMPYANADQLVRQKVNAYTAEQERIRREKEAELRRKQEEEARRLAEEAEKLEAEGRRAEAEITLDRAAMTETYAQSISVPTSQEKIQGISYRTDYEVSVDDEAAVPVSFGGVTIRPVDLAAVKRLAVATKGNIKIPGIRVIENKKVAVR